MKQVKAEGEKLSYWRGIDNRRRTKDYLKSIEDEFGADMTDISSMDRRSMLKVMGASIALSGMGLSCRRPEEKILPYVKEPDNFTAGIAKFFATAQPGPFGASGILVESHQGRPTKIEGNPSHPESLGKASVLNQAAALEIYDPDRSRFVIHEQAGSRLAVEWLDWDVFASNHFSALKAKSGQGLCLVSDSDLSPSYLMLKAELKRVYPAAKFFVHEAMRTKNVEASVKLAFGEHKRVRYHVDQARLIASLFADPFSNHPESLRHMRGYGKNRRVYQAADTKSMNRLYAVEADYSLTGINADHRLRLPLGLAKNLVEALAYELHATYGIDIDLGIAGAKSLSTLVSKPPSYKNLDRKFILVLAKDLASNRGQALIIGGDHLPAEILGLIHVLNLALMGYQRTFDVLEISQPEIRAHLAEPGLAELAAELNRGAVDTLVMLGVNPAYDAPGSLAFSTLLEKAPTTIHLGLFQDETAQKSSWHLPETHFLEHFSDTRSYDGTTTIIQPLIKPLHGARSKLELLSQIAGISAKPLELLKKAYASYEKSVHDGVVADSAFLLAKSLSVNSTDIYQGFNLLKSRAPNKENLELVINFDKKILDGRYANHSWLQELPDPVTKLNWDNALLMSPLAAREYGIKSGVKKNAYVADLVKLSVGDKSVELPVFVMPGLSDYSVLANLGYGRTHAGVIGNNIGVDLYPLVSDYTRLFIHGVKLERTGQTHRLSSTQEQFAMNGDTVQEIDTLTLQGRDPARVTNIADYIKQPLAAKLQGMPDNLLVDDPDKPHKVPLQITDAWDYSKGNQWGMVIDLASCTGCNACVVACQSENNIPVVGKEQVIRGRIMHWLRIDRYFIGDVKAPQAISQPVPCQHCENAPCEPVCPVAATSHDKEGLNAMTYNRCIGTRYCANNCPYKVRRFNYFDFTHTGNLHVEAETLARQKTIKLQRNPDVTVRYRGVMEKCTFCTQRIQEAKMAARRDGHDPSNLADGSVTPACAQTCPSEAITFGNIIDPQSRVSKLKKVDRNYTMLDGLNSRPRTSYLSKLRNPNPELGA